MRSFRAFTALLLAITRCNYVQGLNLLSSTPKHSLVQDGRETFSHVQSTNNRLMNRHDAIRCLLGGGTAAAMGILTKNGIHPASAADTDTELIDVYFGCGCFWHVQHEFVEAERRILKRDDASLTARAAYAGGTAKDATVCYHNARSIGDYGSLGHAEVVSLRIPPTAFEEFAKEYFNLFNDKGERPDQFGDRGSEYRNLIGVPGGSNSPYAKQLVSASMASGDKLDFAIGKGNDGDKRAVTFVMDSQAFPSYVAEQYHQFHDGFNLGENYPNSYNDVASSLAASGTLEKSVCPNGTFGIGIGGL